MLKFSILLPFPWLVMPFNLEGTMEADAIILEGKDKPFACLVIIVS